MAGSGIIFSAGPVGVVPTQDWHLPAFWRMLKDWPDFWADDERPRDFDAFTAWFKAHARDALTGVEAGQPVGCAYLDFIYPGYYANANIFKRRGYGNRKLVTAVVRAGLPYWFKEYSLEKIIAVTRQKSAVRLARRLGFRKDGTLRHHRKVRGVWTDYTLLSLLRGDL